MGFDTNASINSIRVASEAAAAAVPEPSTFALAALGLLGLGLFVRRKRSG